MTQQLEPWALKAVADTALERASGQLRDLLKDLAARLDPFPAFEGMQTIQAVEVEPKGFRAPDKGCVVVCEDGEFYDLNLQLIAGPTPDMPMDQVDNFKPLDLPPHEYVLYAYAAIEALTRELESRGAST